MFPLEFRTCLFHPAELATVWSGHVHMRTPLGDAHMIVGLCKACHTWEEREYKVNGNIITGRKPSCEGCYGKYTGSFR